MITRRSAKVLSIMERGEDAARAMVVSRANRLGRLASLDAPDFIVALELRMLEEALEALFRVREYDPTTDDRLTTQGSD